jgi:HJR/Mrr/RecB family endonuclease
VAAGKTTRQQMINRFQHHDGFDVLILSPVAVGYGVNIQAANHVIHFTRTWNPAKEDQATDRAYRIGQEKNVYVYYPTVVSPEFETFEAKLHTLISEKRALGKDMLNGVGDVSVSDLSDGLQAPTKEVIISRQKTTPEDLSSISAINFEKLVAELLKAQGYSASASGRPGDHGVDVWAIKDTIGYLVQCKSTSKDSGVGIKGINDVVGGAAYYRAKDKKTNFTLAVATNGRFNQTAIEHARNQPETVELWDNGFLANLLEMHSVYLD